MHIMIFTTAGITLFWWDSTIYNKNALMSKDIARTFIHEMTHVWQGQHNTYPREYMLKSGIAQAKGVRDDVSDNGARDALKRIWEKGPIGAWDSYRNRGYVFNMNQMGVNNFNDFNVEQQASIVESWYASDSQYDHLNIPIPGGNMSLTDIRYPYISCNILANAPDARYIPLKSSSNNPPQLGKGADPTIKAIEDLLVRLRFLDPKYADGYMDVHTRDAVKGFQDANGLKIDGDIGGPKSNTRKKMGL